MKPGILQSRIERLNDFKSLAAKYDPTGKFRNEFVDNYVFGK
jgi:xylitol oxidase